MAYETSTKKTSFIAGLDNAIRSTAKQEQHPIMTITIIIIGFITSVKNASFTETQPQCDTN